MPASIDALAGSSSLRCAHLCVDMQRMFAEDTPWRTPWMTRVLPQVTELVARRPEHTVFTRFIPAERPGQGTGSWRRYYERWSEMTLEHLGRDMVELVTPLRRFAPPAAMVDKSAYSPWFRTKLHLHLQERKIDRLIVSGAETDVCVLSTVLGAIDYGYTVILAEDAVCSSSDETHDALLKVYQSRYSQQVEVATTEAILSAWN